MQVPAQVTVGQRTQLFQLAERQTLSMRDQRCQHAEARMLVNYAVQPVVGKRSAGDPLVGSPAFRFLQRIPHSYIVRRTPPAAAPRRTECPWTRVIGSDGHLRPRDR